VITPLLVRQHGPDNYEIIAGERRWRAAQQAELAEVPVLLKTLSDDAAMAVALVDNIQREDLNVIEEAVALQRLVNECGMTHDAVAKSVGRSRAAVSNLLRLLALPAEVKTLVENGDLEMGHARALLSLAVDQQNAVAREVANQALSVRATEQLIARLKTPVHSKKSQLSQDPNIVSLEQQLSDHFSTPVAIKGRQSGKGQVVLSYHSLEALEGILNKLGLVDRKAE
jgi:ParB family transcriptional regulator, chromosome partitioning protein